MRAQGRSLATLDQLKKFSANRLGVEGIWQPAYHFQTYAAAGTTKQITYFQSPVGAGGLTYEDTNMQAAGQFPALQKMLVTGIQVVLFPGSDPTVFGAQAADAFIDDVYTFGKAGYLEFNIGSQNYLRDGPMGKFPAEFGMAGMAALADATTAAATSQSRIAVASWRGPLYEITPVTLDSNTNFNVTLNFPNITALSADARVGVILSGSLYRGN